MYESNLAREAVTSSMPTISISRILSELFRKYRL